MNYFAHGIRFLENPYFLAGTASPDWLSVSDRQTRLRARHVSPYADVADNDRPDASDRSQASDRSEGSDPQHAAFAAGVLQHLADDDWFHSTRAFYETSTELARLFKPLGSDDDFRAGFLGHVAMEMLLDAVLIDRHPGKLDRYYALLEQVDPATIERYVTLMAARPPERLAKFIGIFRDVQFLRGYTEPPQLCERLNQVLSRVRLPPLPVAAIPVLEKGYELVAANAGALLPPERFR